MRSLMVSLQVFILLTPCFAQDFWIQSGLGDSEVEYLVAGPDSSLFAGVYIPGVPQRYAIYRSTNGGISWLEVDDGLPQDYLISQLFSDSVMYTYVAADSAVFRIRNTDTTWTKILSLGSGGLSTSAVSNSAGLMFVGTYGGLILRSTDHGGSWQQSYFAVDSASSSVGEIRSLAISAAGNIIASIKTFHGRTWIVRSTDVGLNWTTISNYGYYFDQFAVSPSGFLLGIENYGVYWLFGSTDEGETWMVIDSSLAGDRFIAILFDAYGKLYACGNGIFVSTDKGASWSNITHNLTPPASGHSLAIGIDEHLYVGTIGSGIWKTAQKVTSVADQHLPNYPMQFSLYQNYPNPFNSSTTIAFSLPHTGYVTLEVFNTLGQNVATLLSQELAAGAYQTKWDATGIGSGTYFYRLQAGSGSETRKLILLR